MSLAYLSTSLFSPFIGWLIDLYGKRIIFLSISNLSLVSCLTLFILLPYLNLIGFYCIIPILLFAIGFSIAGSTIWPIFPIIIDKKYLGLALGIDAALLNLGYLINPFGCGLVYDTVKHHNENHAYPSMLIYLLC